MKDRRCRKRIFLLREWITPTASFFPVEEDIKEDDGDIIYRERMGGRWATSNQQSPLSANLQTTLSEFSDRLRSEPGKTTIISPIHLVPLYLFFIYSLLSIFPPPFYFSLSTPHLPNSPFPTARLWRAFLWNHQLKGLRNQLSASKQYCANLNSVNTNYDHVNELFDWLVCAPLNDQSSSNWLLYSTVLLT